MNVTARQVRDAELKELITGIHADNYSVYGARKIWAALHRQGVQVARCTVERLMRELGLTGVTRGGRKIRTTVADPAADRAPDLLNRAFVAPAPNRVRVADFTYVHSRAGTVYVAFVADTFSRRIVGWSAATSKATPLVLGALEMGLWQGDRTGTPAPRPDPPLRRRIAVHKLPARHTPGPGRHRRLHRLGQHYGTVEDLLGILDRVLMIGTAEERENNWNTVREVTPGRAGTLLSATTPVDRFAAKSAILTPGALLDDAQVKAAAEVLKAWPGSANPDGAGFAMFGMGGRINEIAPDATAFVHRDAAFILGTESTWADHDPRSVVRANLTWLEEFYDAIFPFGPPNRSYQNFPEPQLGDWRTAYGVRRTKLRPARHHEKEL